MIEKFFTARPYAFDSSGPSAAKTFKIQKVEVTHSDNLFVDLFS